MYLIQILLPVASPSNDAQAFVTTREELANKFGGVTAFTRGAAEGVWVSPEGEKEHDFVLMVEILTDAFDRTWWRAYRERLARRFKQDEIHVRALKAEVP